MILVVESGATKTDWMSSGGKFRTRGINSALMSETEISAVVSEAAEFFGTCSQQVSRIYFYAAGLVSQRSKDSLTSVLSTFFPQAAIALESDLMAASRALWGDGSGVVAILGTGSNSCFYREGQILKNVRPGGFILGDEGGGVSMGRTLISDYIKDLLPQNLKTEFDEQYGTGYAEIVENVYRGPNPSGYLASFAPFLLSRLGISDYADKVVRANLESFVRRAVLQYRFGDENVSAGVVGSVGMICRDVLRQIGGNNGVDFVKFIPSPGTDLLNYHECRNFASK